MKLIITEDIRIYLPSNFRILHDLKSGDVVDVIDEDASRLLELGVAKKEEDKITKVTKPEVLKTSKKKINVKVRSE